MIEVRGKWTKVLVAILFVAIIAVALGYSLPIVLPSNGIIYEMPNIPLISSLPKVNDFVVTHVKTPKQVKAIYFSSWAAGSEKFRKEMLDLVENTEINSVVIDIKDYTGKISFKVDDSKLEAFKSSEERIPDIKKFIGELHDRGVYVIGRISSFQDSYLVNIHPEWAVKTKAGAVWKDFRNVKWLDAGATPVWDYLVLIGRQSYAYGFDELNFDYIRFPSDGNMQDIHYDWREGRTRSEVMKSFFKYLSEEFASSSIPISADLFGLTTSAGDDLGIGQVITDALPYFDYVCPMVYPSHFAKGYNGYPKPAQYPYEVVKMSMDSAFTKALNASTSPYKLRPWLQAFDLGAIYTPEMVRKQIKATYDSGLDSWLLWNAASVYNKEALFSKDVVDIIKNRIATTTSTTTKK